jgi:uncharacterized repeat protein (TIGR02543 family)
MNKSLILATLSTLVCGVPLFGADAPNAPVQTASSVVDTTKTPKGLSDSDWSGIRGAYERNRHAIVANKDGSHEARNPGQGWLTKFDGSGFTVTPDAGGWSWGLELAGYGEVTEVLQDGGRISYVRGDGLTEWFVNDGRGLEQGWTLAKRPERAGTGGPIRLHLDVRGSLRPQVSSEGASVAFLSKAGGAALTYGGLKAWDADGNSVLARFTDGEGADTSLCVEVDDIGARYPITVDPIAQQAYLKASNTGGEDYFGQSVAVSGDTVVVGAYGEASSATGVNGNQTDNSGYLAGAAYVFVRSGTTWTKQAYLKASNTGAGDYFGGAGDYFGMSVAVSGDTIVIGAEGEDSSAPGVNGNENDNSAESSGAAYIFTRSGTTWIQQAYIKASNVGAGDLFGHSVSVAGDTVIVGACQEDSNATGVNGNQADNSANDSGAAYVYTRSGTTWTQQAYLKASNTRHEGFGGAVAVSSDTVVIGAVWESSNATGVNGNQADNSASYSGAAYVFNRSGTTWTQQAYLKASNTQEMDFFGFSVAVSGDTVVVGAVGESSNATGVNGDQADNSAEGAGAAYVYTRSGTMWTQQAYLKASNARTDDRFGQSVAVSGDTVAIGAKQESGNSTGVNGDQADNSVRYSGAAYVYHHIDAAWVQQAYIKASNTGDGDNFGCSVSLSGDTLVVGAERESSNATGVNGNQADNSAFLAGAAYVFFVPPRYSLAVTAPHGSLTGDGDYEANNMATLAVTTHPGYIFTGWTGDATGTNNPLSVLMDSNKTITANFVPDTNDDDDDGLTNYQEIVELGTDPTKQDTDNDGAKDAVDAFSLDPAETLDTDHDGIGDNADPDDDGDGLSDEDEINIHHTDPKLADSDGDGLSDPNELQVHLTNPNLADSDNDGFNDGAEISHGTLPNVPDTDGDGFLDGYEVATGKSPLDIADHPALVAEARTAIEFTFPAALGKTYRIEDSPDITTWTTVESGVVGNGAVIQRFYTTRNKSMRYFRVEEGGAQ